MIVAAFSLSEMLTTVFDKRAAAVAGASPPSRISEPRRRRTTKETVEMGEATGTEISRAGTMVLAAWG